jgi:hypothetical protein
MSIINLQDLEKLTSKLYEPRQDSNLIQNANRLKQAYLENFGNFPELFDYLITTKNQHCQFWILDLLIVLLNTNYKNFLNEQKEKFREVSVFIINNYIEKIASVNFIENKLCVLLINFIKHDYPENCPNFFEILINTIFNTENENSKILKVNFFINLLLTFDDELIKFRHTFNDYEVVRSTLIKDHMRITEINHVVFVLNQIIQNEAHMNKKLVKNSIKAVSQLIDWNVINLFSDIINLIKDSLIHKIEYQSECLETINALIEKGMELNQKLDLMKYLNVNQIIQEILSKQKFDSTENSLYVICEIVTNIGNISIECFELVKGLTKGEFLQTNGVVYTAEQQQELFNYICELTNYCLYYSTIIIKYSSKIDLKIALHLCDFISNITSYFKTNPFLAETMAAMLKSLTQTLENSLLIPGSYDIKHEMLSIQEDDDFFSFRKEYTILYQNLFNIATIKSFIYYTIIEKLENVSNGVSDLYAIEHTLHIINSIPQNITYADTQNSDENFNKILYYLFSINFVSVDSDNILLLYFDTIAKYLQYILNNDALLIQVTNLYLSKRGIMNNNPIVGARISSSFDKFIEKTKTQLGKMDLIYEISEYLKNFIKFIICENKNFQLLIEYNILFKTLSVTILQKHYNDEKRQVIYKEICEIFMLIFVNFGLNEEIFIEASKCITNFLKCFGFELTPNIKIIFIDFFNEFYQNVYMKLTPTTKLNYSMITIIQRLIPILGKESLQYIEYFIFNQMNFSELDLYEDCSKLLQNATQLWKKDSKALIQNCFYLFYVNLKDLKLPESNVSELDKNILSIFSNFVKLIANICNDIIEVLFEGSLKNVNVGELIDFLIYIGYNVIDYNIRRSIVKSLKSITIHLLKLLTQMPNNLDEAATQSFLNYIQVILNGSFRIYSKLNPTDNTDFNVRFLNFIFFIFP